MLQWTARSRLFVLFLFCFSPFFALQLRNLWKKKRKSSYHAVNLVPRYAVPLPLLSLGGLGRRSVALLSTTKQKESNQRRGSERKGASRWNCMESFHHLARSLLLRLPLVAHLPPSIIKLFVFVCCLCWRRRKGLYAKNTLFFFLIDSSVWSLILPRRVRA